MTDKQTPPTSSDSTKSTDNPKPASAIKNRAKPTTSTRKPAIAAPVRKRSKTAVLALICSVAALAGLGGGYVWQNQQHMGLMQELVAQNQAQLQATEQQLQQLINQQQTATLASAEKLAFDALKPVQEEIAQLNSVTESLKQNDPTDWLVHEAEYLIRIASRAMWLEKDAKVAIDLLIDADIRIKELNDPQYLPVRQFINQDIESLKLLPELATDDVILKLIALSGQISDLPIAMAHLPDATEAAADFELTENATDWRENLTKTWQKFMADFITVKRRTANVEALLTPSQQQNLRQNLQLKMQLSQWAASQHNNALYDTSLTEIQAWLADYFDMDDEKVKNFHQAIQLLKSEIIELTLPKKLDSLNAIRAIIKGKSQRFEHQKEIQVPLQETKESEIKGIPEEGNVLELPTNEDETTNGDNGAII